MSLKDMYKENITKAIKAADMITDNYQKAKAYASIAQALAMMSQNESISECVADTIQPMVKVPKEPAREEKPKTKAEPTKTGKKLERKAEEIDPPAKSEKPEFTSDWTDEAYEYYSEQLAYIKELTDQVEDVSVMDGVVEEFSNGVYKKFDEASINPRNIEAFCDYLKALEASAEDEQAAC